MQLNACIMVQLILSFSHSAVLFLSSFSFRTIPVKAKGSSYEPL